MLFDLDRKGLTAFFLLVKTVIEIKKNPICKIQPSSCWWKSRGIQFLKRNFTPANENGF